MRLSLVFLFCFLYTVSSAKVIGRIHVSGNGKTKTKYIELHLPFSSGDTIPDDEFPQRLEQAKASLLNTLLFNAVKVDSLPVDGDYTDILVQVTERWYFWPIPDVRVYETNFNTWLKSPNLARLSYGLDLYKYNIGGVGIELLATGTLGYVKGAGAELRIPFLTRHFGLTGHFSYAERAELVYGTEDNLRLFYTNSDAKRVFTRTRTFADFYFKPSIRTYFKARIGYSHFKLDSALADLNEYLPGAANSGGDAFLTLQFRSDQRNYQPYPTEGRYLDVALHQHLVGGQPFTLALGEARYYFKMNDRAMFGLGIQGKTALQGNNPYLLVEALGYRNYVRGYEDYVIDGRHHALVKSNFKLKVIDKELSFGKVKDVRFRTLPFQAYLTVFADAGYVWRNENNFSNSLQETLLSGVGLGLDLVSYYDRVIRVEVSMNHLNQTGIYLHFTQPI